MVKFKPLNKQVLLKPVMRSEKTSGGILLPLSSQQASGFSVVVASASKDLKIGDKVMTKQDSGVAVNLEGEEYRLVKSEDVLGVWE